MATTNQLSGGGFQDVAGNPLANGSLTMVLSQDGQVNGDTQVSAGVEITIQLDGSGNVISSPAQSVWPNDVISPSGTFYTVSAYTAEGQLVWGPNAQQVLSTPSPYDIGNWVPASVNTGAGGGSSSNDVTSVFGRTGTIFAEVGDYAAFYAPLGSGGVVSVFGRTGTVVAAGGDYTAAQVTNAADVTAANTFSQEQTFNGGLNATFGAFSEYITAPNLMNSFNGRSGTVVPVSGDYDVSQVTGAAPIDSPTFTGVPAAPTAAAGTDTTQLATTAFVQAAVSGGSPFESLTTTGTSGAATLASGVLNIPEYAGAVSSLTTTGTSGAATLSGGVLNIPEYSSGSSGVTSFNSRTGAVVPASGDYTAAQVTNAAAVNAQNTFTESQSISSSNGAALGLNWTPTSTIGIFSMLAPNLAAGNSINFSMGTAASTSNNVYFFYKNVGAGSGLNSFGFTFYGQAFNGWTSLANGNNGVDNNSPAYPLDVSGTINTTGNLQTTQATAATSSENYNSPALTLTGNYWNGSASAADTWTLQNVVTATGITPYASELVISHSGASGYSNVNIGNLSVGNLNPTNTTCFGSPTSYVFSLASISTATSGTNYSSPLFSISGDYWNGSANSTDAWAWQNVLGTGTNPTSILTLSKENSTSGASGVSFGSYPVAVGALTAASLHGSNTASIATLSGAGTGATASFSSGYNGTATAGSVQINTGTGPTSGDLFTISWSGALPTNPNAVISADSAASAALLPFFQSSTSTSLTFGVTNVPSASTLYGFSYVAVV